MIKTFYSGFDHSFLVSLKKVAKGTIKLLDDKKI